MWALGVTLYEMLSGGRPFEGPSYAAVLHAVMSMEPRPLQELADVPLALDLLVRHMLRKDTAGRPQSMAEIARALDAIQADPQAPYALPATASSSPVSTPSLAPRAGSVVVLPFVNAGGQPEDAPLCDGLTDELIGALGQVRAIRVTARTTAFAARAMALDAQAVARLLGVSDLVEGTVWRRDERLKVTANLVRAADASVVQSVRYDRHLDDVFAMQEELARAIVAALAPALETDTALALAPRRDVRAYEAFLKDAAFLGAAHGARPPARRRLLRAGRIPRSVLRRGARWHRRRAHAEGHIWRQPSSRPSRTRT